MRQENDFDGKLKKIIEKIIKKKIDNYLSRKIYIKEDQEFSDIYLDELINYKKNGGDDHYSLPEYYLLNYNPRTILNSMLLVTKYFVIKKILISVVLILLIVLSALFLVLSLNNLFNNKNYQDYKETLVLEKENLSVKHKNLLIEEENNKIEKEKILNPQRIRILEQDNLKLNNATESKNKQIFLEQELNKKIDNAITFDNKQIALTKKINKKLELKKELNSQKIKIANVERKLSALSYLIIEQYTKQYFIIYDVNDKINT